MAEPDDLQVAWLTSFLAVVDNGTFTAAAQATHRSQPRVSAHVAGLERFLGARLLDRGSRRVSLTEAGTRFLPHARAAVGEIRSGLGSVVSLSGALHGSIVVGSFAGPSGTLLAPLIKRFREQHTAVSIDLREGGPRWLEDAVVSYAADLAVRTADVPMQHRLSSEELLQERILLAIPRGHPLADGPADPGLIDGQTLVVTGAPTEGWTDFTDRLSARGVAPDRIITVTHPTTVIALVRAGLGLGLLGEMAAAITAFGDVETRPLPDDLWTRSIRIYWNSGRELSAAAQGFLAALRQECERLGHTSREVVAAGRLLLDPVQSEQDVRG